MLNYNQREGELKNMYSLYEVENKYHSTYIGTCFTIEECCAIINNEFGTDKIESDRIEIIKSQLKNNDTCITSIQCGRFEYTYKIIKGE